VACILLADASKAIRDTLRRINGKLRDECLNGEIFYSLKEAQIVIEQWRVEYNTRRPHSALGYRPPAPAAYSPLVPPNSVSQGLAVM
jgi:transposase InsO family protein